VGTALFGFADGTDSAPGGFAMVGERGPEIMHVPRGAQIIPNHKIGAYASGVGMPDLRYTSQGSSYAHVGAVHIHVSGITDPDRFARHVSKTLPGYLQRASPAFGPASK
jgi:hypothetical protein